MVIGDLVKTAFEAACAKGFHADKPPNKEREDLAVQLLNLVSEVSELWEAYRRNKLHAPCDKAEGMAAIGHVPLTNFEEELADIVIRCADIAGFFGIDLENAVKVKLAYNKSRPLRNGGKLA